MVERYDGPLRGSGAGKSGEGKGYCGRCNNLYFTADMYPWCNGQRVCGMCADDMADEETSSGREYEDE